MPRVCTVCTHENRAEIDTALVAGTPLRDIAIQNEVGKDALMRHKAEHLPASLVQAAGAEEVKNALNVLDQLRAINETTRAILTDARKAKDGELALKAIDRIQRQIELQAKLLGDIDDRPQINVLLMPEWITVRAVLIAALGPFPEARAAVASRLLELETGRETAL